MQYLRRKYEEEKRKLEELGLKSLEQGIPLSDNEAVQAQRRMVDELVKQMCQGKDGYSQTSRLAFEEESRAFQALFDSIDIVKMPEFEYWEDKFQLKLAVLYERLYLQGLKDGMQFVNAFTTPSVYSD